MDSPPYCGPVCREVCQCRAMRISTMNKLKCIGWVNVYSCGEAGPIFPNKPGARNLGLQYGDAYLRTVRVYVVRGKGKKK
jgi:hypothetical protein